MEMITKVRKERQSYKLYQRGKIIRLALDRVDLAWSSRSRLLPKLSRRGSLAHAPFARKREDSVLGRRADDHRPHRISRRRCRVAGCQIQATHIYAASAHPQTGR